MKKTPFVLFSLAALAFGCNRQIVRPAALAFPKMADRAAVFTTDSAGGHRLSKMPDLRFEPFGQPFETQPFVLVDASRQFQTFVGIGGALTDASAETFSKLDVAAQNELLTAYFDKTKGIGYSLARTNINSCDFSSDMYTYVADGDRELKTFSIAHDERFKIPFIKKATAAAGGSLPLFVSPWSPPAWMKDNRDMLHGGKLLPEMRASWADYYVKYIAALEKTGVPVWGLTVQNEPMAKQTWESCMWTADEERDFIKNHLGPALWRGGMKSKKLIAWDHNRDLIYQRAATYLSDPEAAKYIWAIGFHWYESWTGGHQFDNVRRTAEAFPSKNLLLTEACNYPFSWKTFDQWHWGERYGENMIEDFNNGACGWTDWNVLLDDQGGPNHVGNFCFAPIHAQNGRLRYMNSYFYIGHFSKFIQPGARRAACSSSRAQLLATAFVNPDGSLAVVVMNPTAERLSFRLMIGGKAAETVSEPRSISTFLL